MENIYLLHLIFKQHNAIKRRYFFENVDICTQMSKQEHRYTFNERIVRSVQCFHELSRES